MPQEIEQAPIDESEKWVSFLDADFARQRRICFYWKPPASWPGSIQKAWLGRTRNLMYH
jgi:hypothetical protein